jgi:homocysteine S-methyltransferase
MNLSAALAGTLVVDGGLGSELERRGCDVTDHLWSARVLLNHSEKIAEVHRDYLAAGAECIIAASYQISFDGFRKAGLTDDDTERALRQAVEVALEARAHFEKTNGQTALVAASVGPLGAAMADGSEFHGNYDCSYVDLIAFHSRRMAILTTAGADLLACETIPSQIEAKAILDCLSSLPEAKAWFSFQCRNGTQAAHGELVSDCARMLDISPQVVAIGVNCTAPHYVAWLIREIRSATKKPIVVYPNAGRRWDANARTWTGDAPDFDLGEFAQEWKALGAQWIGGCCGTTPEDIRGVARALKPQRLRSA